MKSRGPESRRHRGKLGMVCLMLCLFAAPAAAKEVAARVQFLVGDVTATSPDGKLRLLQKGDRVYSGDTIRTGDESTAQLIYRDRSRMAVRVNTEFMISEYRYDEGNQSGSRSIFSLLQGALRSVTGLIGHANKNNVTINTPNATIGIRGTDHEVVHIVQQASSLAQAGTYDKVYLGGTVMRTTKGNLNLDIKQVGFVGGTPGKVLKPVKIVDLPKAITDQIINKIPLQARIEPKQPEQRSNAPSTKKRVDSATTTTRTLDSANKLDTSTTLQKSFEGTTTLDPDLNTKTLDSTTTLQKSFEGTTNLDPGLSTKTLDSTTIKSLEPSLSNTIQTAPLKSTITSPTTTESLKSTIISPTTTEKLLAPTTTETLRSTITSPTTTIKK